jgi:hypothetical protein
MSGNLTFEAATATTEPQLRRLLRDNPVSGEIHVSLEREPDAFYAAGISGDSWQMMLARDHSTGNVIASGGRFELDVYINGEARRTGYFGELRAEGGLRQRRKLLFGSYQKMHDFHEAGDVPFYLTTIVADNTPARRLLEAGLGDMPTYRPLEPMVTLTIPVGVAARRGKGKDDISAARASEIGEIAAALARQGPGYQFHPVWSKDTLTSEIRCRGLAPEDFFILRNDGVLRGCLALWDQREFKQTVIRGYSKRLGRVRPLFNLVAPMFSRPRLPPPGSQLQSAFLSHVAVQQDDEEALVSLIGHACHAARLRKLDYVMVAFAERNPLAESVRKNFSCHEYVSMIYVVYWKDSIEAVDNLDDRIPHPEVAIL